MQKRNTIQRSLVYNSALELKNHPTADEIYLETRIRCPKISKGTVYRNINLLVKEGRLKRIEVPNAPDRIDFNTSEHCHIICEKCGRCYDIEIECGISRFKETEIDGYTVHSIDVLCRGICPGCK